MVQVFGNRIIGGVGAPGGGMSEAFGAGVNTALGQRESRQGMVGEAQRQRLLEQEFAWKGEDREEAKRRRAAADASAAAAKARGIAAIEATRSGGAGGPYFRLGAKSTAGGATAPAPRAGVDTSFPLGVAAPTTTGAGSSSAGGRVSGGAGSTSVGGGTGTDRLGAPAQTRFRPAGVAPVAAMNYAQFVEQARSGRPLSTDQLIAAVEANTLTGQQAADVQAMIESGYIPSAQEQMAANAPGVTPVTETYVPAPGREAIVDYLAGAFGGRTRGEQAAVDAERAAAIAAAAPAAAPPAEVTIQGPNGPVTVPTAPGALDFAGVPAMGQGTTTQLGFAPSTGAAPVVPLAPGDLGFAGVPAMGQGTTTQLGFGPRLGAAPTPTEQFLSAVGAAPPGEIDIDALRSSYDGPLYDPLFAQSAEQLRTALVYAAEDAAARGDVGGYVTAMAKVREQEMLILSQQLEVGLDEAKRFNSPQRLSAVLSMVYGGADIFIAPTEGGLADVYVNGQLSETGTSIDELAGNVRIMIDTGFREQMAAAAAEERAADLEVRKAVATEQGKLEAQRDDDLVRAELQAAGFLPPDEAVRFDEYSTGEVIGFDFAGNEVIRYAPVPQDDGTVVLREVRN